MVIASSMVCYCLPSQIGQNKKASYRSMNGHYTLRLDQKSCNYSILPTAGSRDTSHPD